MYVRTRATCSANQVFLDLLHDRVEQLERSTHNKSQWRALSLKRAAASVAAYPGELKNDKDLMKLRGVGQGIALMLVKAVEKAAPSTDGDGQRMGFEEETQRQPQKRPRAATTAKAPKQYTGKWWVIHVLQGIGETTVTRQSVADRAAELGTAAGAPVPSRASLLSALEKLELEGLVMRRMDENRSEHVKLSLTGHHAGSAMQAAQAQALARASALRDSREGAAAAPSSSPSDSAHSSSASSSSSSRSSTSSMAFLGAPDVPHPARAHTEDMCDLESFPKRRDVGGSIAPRSSCSSSAFAPPETRCVGAPGGRPAHLPQTVSRSQDKQRTPKALNRAGSTLLRNEVSAPFTFTPHHGAVTTPVHPTVSSDSSGAVPTYDPEAAAGEWELVLLLDNRERLDNNSRFDFESRLLDAGLRVESRALPLGDMLWVFRRCSPPFDEWVSDYIVERKAVTDLAVSIKDGRYQEQKFRLHDCRLSKVIYLVEGNPASNVVMCTKALETAMAETQVRDGFVMRSTESHGESIQFLVNMHNLLASMTTHAAPGRWQGPPEHEDWRSYESFKARNEKMRLKTAGEVFGAMVKQIKGFSGAKASAVVDRYPTPRSMFDCFERELAAATDESRRLHFQDIVPTGHTTRIGKVLSCRLHDLMTTQ